MFLKRRTCIIVSVVTTGLFFAWLPAFANPGESNMEMAYRLACIATTERMISDLHLNGNQLQHGRSEERVCECASQRLANDPWFSKIGRGEDQEYIARVRSDNALQDYMNMKIRSATFACFAERLDDAAKSVKLK